jgi:shikimate dehydrogenase
MRVEYNNQTRLLAVIGDPVAHSLSPLFHNTMARILGLNYLYLACRVAPGTLDSWLAAVKTMDIAGFNATMPHKLELIPRMDQLTPAARRYGAVNTVRVEAGRFLGHNTDGDGFARSLLDCGRGFAGAKVVVLGAGGAACSIVRKAVDDGAASVWVMNRTKEKAAALCAENAMVMHPAGLEETVPPDTDLLINTLPLGATWPQHVLEEVGRDCMVCDILYEPRRTQLMQAAEQRGLQTANGLGMLIYQAIYAFGFFTGVEIDDAEMAARLRTVLSES